MAKKKDSNSLPPKVIGFDGNDPEDRKLYNLLDRTRYNQSKFIKRLLSDFYSEFGITEETPYEDVCYIVKAYIDKEDSYTKYQVLGQIVNRGNPAPLQQEMIAGAATHAAGSMNSHHDQIQMPYTSSDEDDAYIGTMANGFDSMLDD